MPRKKIIPNMGQLVVLPIRNFSLLGKNIAYNPDAIKYDTYDEMRKFPTIAGALDVIKLPIISIDWYIESSDSRRKEFVEKVLRKLWAGFIRDLLTAYDFGFSAFEKVPDYNEDNLIYWKKLLSLNVFHTKIKRTEDLSYDGIYFEPQTSKGITIPADKSFIFTYKKEFENMYGQPRIKGAYTAWYIARYILEFTNVFYEKYTTPNMLGYAPSGAKVKYQGKDMDATDYLLDVLKSLQNASAVVLPHTGGKRDELKYHIEVLESQRTGGDFINYLKYLDNQMFTGCGIPPLSYSAGEKGSYALFETQAGLFAQGVDGDLTIIKQHIDNYIIKPLIEYNFGDVEKDDTRFVYQSLANRDKELTRQVMLALVQQGKVNIAIKYLQDALGIPAIEAGELLEEVKKEATADKESKIQPIGQQFSRRKFKRPPNELEKNINFERIEKQYKDNDEMIITGLMPILTKQKINLIESLQKGIKNPRQIPNIDISLRGEYEKKVIDIAKKIFNDGVLDVKEEMELRISIPDEAKDWVNARAKNIAEKHLNDLKFSVIGAVLTGISKELSEKEILYIAENKFNEYTEHQLERSAELLNQKFYSEGREWTATEAGIKYAEWSAVLDTNTCDYCESRDEMIIELNSPDFSEYSPGNVHENCRCMWIYFEENELPENYKDWKAPLKSDINKYYSE